jgi:hypothetical protein
MFSTHRKKLNSNINFWKERTMTKRLKVVLMISVALFFTVVVSAFAEEADGFRGLKWGTNFSTVKGNMIYVRTDPSYGGIKLYSKKGDELKIGAAKLESIEYGFWQDKLYGVTINFNGYVNFSALKESTFQKFGSGYQDNQFMQRYFWFGTVTTMMMYYSEVQHKGYLSMSSKEISEQQKSFDDGNAKKGAETGF